MKLIEQNLSAAEQTLEILKVCKSWEWRLISISYVRLFPEKALLQKALGMEHLVQQNCGWEERHLSIPTKESKHL